MESNAWKSVGLVAASFIILNYWRRTLLLCKSINTALVFKCENLPLWCWYQFSVQSTYSTSTHSVSDTQPKATHRARKSFELSLLLSSKAFRSCQYVSIHVHHLLKCSAMQMNLGTLYTQYVTLSM